MGTPIWSSCESARTSSCGDSATAVSSGPTNRWPSTAGTRGPSPSARPGKAPTSCRRWPSATTSRPIERGARTAGWCGRTAAGYAPPVALSPGYCTLSVLFSDWNRSGQRDLRMTNDRHYYLDGTDQLWRVDRRRSPGGVHRGRRVAPPADLGDGHRQRGHHRRRLSGGVPDESGRQQAADPRRRAGPADVRGHRLGTRGHRPSPVHRRRRAPVHGLARRVRRRQQRRVPRPVRRQGQRRGPGGLRDA